MASARELSSKEAFGDLSETAQWRETMHATIKRGAAQLCFKGALNRLLKVAIAITQSLEYPFMAR